MSGSNLDKEFDIDEEFDSINTSQHVGPNPLVVKLQQAFRSEVHAPTILPYAGDLVAEIRRELKKWTNDLENYDEDMDDSETLEKDRVTMRFWRTLMLMDLERVRYSLTRYLRCRLNKIENSLEFIARDTDSRDRLSDEEETFLSKLSLLKNNHFRAVVFDKLTDVDIHHFPDYRFQNAAPNEKDYVFARLLKNISQFNYGDQNMDIEAGMIMICQYGNLKQYIEKSIDDRELELI